MSHIEAYEHGLFQATLSHLEAVNDTLGTLTPSTIRDELSTSERDHFYSIVDQLTKFAVGLFPSPARRPEPVKPMGHGHVPSKDLPNTPRSPMQAGVRAPWPTPPKGAAYGGAGSTPPQQPTYAEVVKDLVAGPVEPQEMISIADIFPKPLLEQINNIAKQFPGFQIQVTPNANR